MPTKRELREQQAEELNPQYLNGRGEIMVFHDVKERSWEAKGVFREVGQKCDKCDKLVTYDPNMGMCESCKQKIVNEIKRSTNK